MGEHLGSIPYSFHENFQEDYSMVNPFSSFGYGPEMGFPYSHQNLHVFDNLQERHVSHITHHQSLDAQLEVQTQEMDCLLQIQNEKLRSVLQEQRTQHLNTLLKTIETKFMWLMSQKEESLTKAKTRSMELESMVRKAEIECESWKNLTKQHEDMVMGLSNTLKQVKLIMETKKLENRVDDAESSVFMGCKGCNRRESCMLFLPCRHISLCKSCEALMASCPVCNCVKKGSMEVYF